MDLVADFFPAQKWDIDGVVGRLGMKDLEWRLLLVMYLENDKMGIAKRLTESVGGAFYWEWEELV